METSGAQRMSSRKLLSSSLCLLLCLSLIVRPSFARANDASAGLTLPTDVTNRMRGNEFVSGENNNAVLMKVNLLGAVGKPGIHYVPMQTDLVTLLSLAGGPTDSAKLGEVTIKRRGANNTFRLIDVDLDDVLRGEGGTNPQLQANDIIMVPASKPVLSQNTVALVGFIGSILSIVLVGFVLSDKLGSNK